MTKKKYRRYSPEFKRHALKRASEDGVTDKEICDFYPRIAIVCALVSAGIYLPVSGDQGMLVMLAVLVTNGMLGWQFHTAALYWKRTVTEVPEA